MPELPEVEVCRRGLLPELLGRRIEHAIVRQPQLRHLVPGDLSARLAGRLIIDIRRRGKYLAIACQAPDGHIGHLLIHLGMSGNLRFVAGEAPGKHDHVDLVLDQCTLRYGDPRRFGLILWHNAPTPDDHPLLASLGIEPLEPDFTGQWLKDALSRRSGPVKPVLMDSHMVVGIGNIYASESLFRAGISPLRAANRIGRERVNLLADAIRQTLLDAIAAGGSSIRDYVHSDGGAGCFQVDCGVYERAGLPCRRCHGTIRQIRQTGRSTYYCPECQR